MRRYRDGEMTSTNPVATIFAWTGALRKRGQLDKNAALAAFADRLEAACLDTIESGVMTKDLAVICAAKVRETPETIGFIRAVRGALEKH
jgi:isocitrate dehydrogenase